MDLLVVFYLLAGYFVKGINSSENCSNMEPKISINYIDDSILLRCSHVSPIRWGLPMAVNGMILDIHTKYKSTDNQYICKLRLVSHLNTFPEIFTCLLENEEGLECSATSVLVTGNDMSIIDEMYKSVTIFGSPVISNGTDCDITLLYRVVADETHFLLEYKWQTNIPETDMYKTLTYSWSPDLFRKYYASVPQIPHCVRKLQADDPCETDCYVTDENQTAMVFVVEISHRPPFLAKGLFDVINNNQRDFHWEWNIPMERMFKIDAPSIFYRYTRENITCTYSSMLFSHMEFFDLQSSFDNLTYAIYKDDKYEYTAEYGMWKVRREIMLLEVEDDLGALLCVVKLINSSQSFSTTLNFSLVTPQEPEILETFPLHNIPAKLGEKTKLTCLMSGKPRPVISWTLPTQALQTPKYTFKNTGMWEVESSLELLEFQKQHEGTYTCNGTNDGGSVSGYFVLQLHQQPIQLSGARKAGLAAALGGVISLFVLILCGMYIKIIFLRQKYKRKTFTAKQEFLEGRGPQQNLVEEHDDLVLPKPTFLSQPFDDTLEVPYNQWTIDDKILGSGNFGLVRRGRVILVNGAEEVEVAVKTLRLVEDIEDFRRFLYELKLMKCVGHHPNIVCLVASCVERIDERDVMIGLELCTNGSLEEYLRKHGSQFKQVITEEPTCNKRLCKHHDGINDLTDFDLLTWAFQIASGMEFLASKLVLHGDLAARNVLLCGDKVAKISDFGLSRHLDENEHYQKRSTVGIPWKYLPPESLMSHVFSTASDVWAYGVTLWEIFSLGQTPYPGVRMGRDFLDQLLSGVRLNKPRQSTDFVYGIMEECWHEYPSQRPSFTYLKHQFGAILETIHLEIKVSTSSEDNSLSVQALP